MRSDSAIAGPSLAVKLCGTESIDPASRRLSAGKLSAELETGQLRYVSYAGIEVLRGVAFLIRDENWGTYAPRIDKLEIEEDPESFTVAYRAVCADTKQRLIYEARISGSSDGSLLFEAVATPETDFVTNRAGFIVLHPAGLAGRKLKVSHVDGRESETQFPERISPSQPVFDIRSLAHEVAPGLWATCRMEGDAFEMEDQRNWTDASYKTYVRPLALPWGYTLAKGSRHEQSVRLSIAGRIDDRGAAMSGGVTIALGLELETVMPDLGVALLPEETDAALAADVRLRALNPGFLVCRVDMRDGRGLAKLEAYRQAAEATQAALVLEIVVADEMGAAKSLAPVAAAAARARLALHAVVISTAADLKSWQPGAKRPEEPTVDEIAEAGRTAFPGVKLGGGMLSTFTELNRKRPKAELFDFVTHTTCSIVHAADDRSVMETLETLPAIIASTRDMIGGRAYHIGPSAIAARDNPYGKGVADNPTNSRVCLTNKDPRQRGLFNAAWTLGYVAACAYGGVAAAAMGAATGPLGFIHRRAGDRTPYFDSIDEPAVYPAFHVIAGLARGAGRRLIGMRQAAAGRVAALAWIKGDQKVLWLANLTAVPMKLRIDGLDGDRLRISVIDAANFERAARNPDALSALARPFNGAEAALDAYAVARIE
jgi:D-apionolactonase